MKSSKANVSLGNLGTNYHTPEIHQLASLEADLILTEGYCNQCKKGRIIMDRNTPKSKAMEYAGKVIEDARNYQLNAPTADTLIKFYKAIKPLLVPLFKGLEKYRTKEGTKKLLKGFIEEYGEGKKTGSLVMQTAEIIKENDGIDVLKDFLIETERKELEQLISELGKTSRKKLVRDIRDISKKLRTEDTRSENNIVNNMTSFIRGCSNLGESYIEDKCESYKSNITESRKELEKLIDKRECRDLAFGASWFLDVVASIGVNLSDKEFEGFKLMAQTSLKEFLEELDI